MKFLRTKKEGNVRKLVVMLFMVFAMIMLSAGCASAETQVKEQTSDFYVNDFASLFSDEQKELMMERAINLDEEYGGTQVVVTTIESLDGMTMEKYANTMYNQYGIGEDSKGALIILSTGDREVRIEVGNGLEGYLTDSVSGRLIDDYALEYLKNDEFATGLVNLQEAVVTYIIENVPSDVLLAKTVESTSTSEEAVLSSNVSNNEGEEKNSIIPILFAILIIFLVFFFDMFLVTNKRMKEQKERYENALNKARRDASSLKMENAEKLDENKITISKLREQLNNANNIRAMREKEHAKFVEESRSWHDLALYLYPNLDEEVRALKEKRDKDAAETAFKQMKNIAEGKLGRREDFHELEQANKIYENLTSDEKQYFPDAEWLKDLKSKLNDAKNDYDNYQVAKEAETRVHSIIDNISSPDEDDVERLDQAMRYYRVLSSATKAYFSTALLEQLKHMKKMADTDFAVQERIRHEEAERRRREEEEREERRRRESSYHHSSSSNSFGGGHSSFGGHGGHSSGGGAGRSF